MGERLRTTAAQHPGRALGVLAAVAVLGTALAAGSTSRLALSTVASRGPALQIRVNGALPSGSAPFRVAIRTMRAQLSSDPAVTRVVDVGRPRQTSLMLVSFGVRGRQLDAAIAGIEHSLDPGPLSVSFRGPVATVGAAKDDALGDLVLLLIALPVVALVAAATLGTRPAGVALLAAVAAAALAAFGSELVGGALEISWLALVGAVAAGSLLTLQLCAMLRAGAGPAALWASGLAAAVTFGVTGALGIGYLASLGLGGALGSLLAAPASLTAMGAAETIDPPSAGNGPGGPWRRIVGLVGWRAPIAVAIALLAIALLVIVALPAGRLAVAAIGATRAPRVDAGRLGAAAGLAALVTAALAWALCRRASMAVAATLVAAFPAAAATGLIVVTFQEGRLEGALGYTSNGAVQLGSAAAAITIVAAVSAAQAVGLAWAAGEPDARFSGLERVLAAISRCGPPAALACLAGTAAGIALGVGSRSFLKEFGLGVAAGLVLELLIVMALLAPALLRLTPARPEHQ